MTKGTPNENSFNIDEKGRGLKLRNRNFVSFFGNLWNRHITKRHYKNPISWLLTFSAMTLTCDYIMCHSHFSSSRAAPTKRGISSQGPFFHYIFFLFNLLTFSWYHAFKLLCGFMFLYLLIILILFTLFYWSLIYVVDYW